jgi:hypothetical protein
MELNTPKIAAYVSAWNLIDNGFDYQTSLRAMLAFFDEVVVAVNTSTDSTLLALQSFADQIENAGRLRIISTSFSYTDVTFDGAVKNAALQACSKGPDWAYCQMDLDETVLLSQRAMWREYVKELLVHPVLECFMFPSLDLWGSKDKIRADKPIGLKFRLHKGGLYRGVWNGAWLDAAWTRFDISRSDSCELINEQGNLARASPIVPTQYLHPASCFMLTSYPLVIHNGYLDYNQRVKVNKAIWADHWKLRNGGQPAEVFTDVGDMRELPVVPHGLKLE